MLVPTSATRADEIGDALEVAETVLEAVDRLLRTAPASGGPA